MNCILDLGLHFSHFSDFFREVRLLLVSTSDSLELEAFSVLACSL